jgi:preprotein translocase subunit SecB
MDINWLHNNQMAQKKKSDELKLHPIQIISLGVLELYIRSNERPDISKKVEADRISFSVGHNEYDKEKSIIQVATKIEVGMDKKKPKTPFSMRIELIGEFKIDEKKFPVDKIIDWALRNAPFIIFPYLREHAYSLTVRCGFSPMVLPLMQVPTFQIISPKTAKPQS